MLLILYLAHSEFPCFCLKEKRDDALQKKRLVPPQIEDEKDDKTQVCAISLLKLYFYEHVCQFFH